MRVTLLPLFPALLGWLAYSKLSCGLKIISFVVIGSRRTLSVAVCRTMAGESLSPAE